MPEVQAHAERLTAALAGRRLARFELLNFAALKTFDPPVDDVVEVFPPLRIVDGDAS